MNNITYCDELLPRSRRPWLYFLRGGQLPVRFEGKSIPGVCAVISERFKKNGKWSGTTYSIRVADGVRPLPGAAGWETFTFLEGLAKATGKPCDSWGQVADAVGLTVEQAKAWIGPTGAAAETLNKREADLATL